MFDSPVKYYNPKFSRLSRLVVPFDPLKITVPEPEKRRGRRGRRSSGAVGNSMSPQRAQPINDQGYNGFNDIYGSGQGQPMNDQGFPGATYDQGDWGGGFDQGMRR